MTYDIYYTTLYTRIDQFNPDGTLNRTVYLHRSEYRHWDA